jgi:flagellar hook-associated protein 2
MTFAKEATAVDRDGKLTDKDFTSDQDRAADISKDYFKAKEKTGLLAGDNAVLRLSSGLKTIISGAYPNRKETGFRTLAEIGISTGQIGSSWEKIQEGILQIDEEMLTKALNENPEAVKELFATDINQDAITDEGVGFRILEHMKPYTQFTGGIVNSKIKLLEDNISDNKKKIKNHETHMLAYESKLKQRFLYMEQGVGKNKSVGNYLQNNLRGAQRGE